MISLSFVFFVFGIGVLFTENIKTDDSGEQLVPQNFSQHREPTQRRSFTHPRFDNYAGNFLRHFERFNMRKRFTESSGFKRQMVMSFVVVSTLQIKLWHYHWHAKSPFVVQLFRFTVFLSITKLLCLCLIIFVHISELKNCLLESSDKLPHEHVLGHFRCQLLSSVCRDI